MVDKGSDINPLASFSGSEGSGSGSVPFLLCPPTENVSLSQPTTSQSSSHAEIQDKSSDASNTGGLHSEGGEDVQVDTFVGQERLGQSASSFPSSVDTAVAKNTPAPPPKQSFEHGSEHLQKLQYQRRYVSAYQAGNTSQAGQAATYGMAGPAPPGSPGAQQQPQNVQIFSPEQTAGNSQIPSEYDSMQSFTQQTHQQQQFQYPNVMQQDQAQQQMYDQSQQYDPSVSLGFQPVIPHWFYKRDDGAWVPFTKMDSSRLENQYANQSPDLIATDGGRFDVNVSQRIRYPVYWSGTNTEIKRGTWFYRGDENAYLVPYEENISEQLESIYYQCVTENKWQQRLDFENGESIIMYNHKAIVHTRPHAEWMHPEETAMRPRAVMRGLADIYNQIPEGEKEQIDYLVLVVHGIGPFADFQLRDIISCVDDLRNISIDLQQSHVALEKYRNGRVEFLPVMWRNALHGDDAGVDSAIKRITLPSIAKMRNFTNETLLDILFYTSPSYCQTIVNSVAAEMNRIYKLFRERNPGFNGQVSIAGHSLGSCITFDLLMHQGDNKQVVNQLLDLNLSERGPAEVIKSTCKVENELPSVDSISEKSEAGSLAGDDASKVSEKEEDVETVASILTDLNLMEYIETFKSEDVDLDSLELCSEADLKDLGLKLGHRRKLTNHLEKRAAEKAEKEKAQSADNDLKKTEKNAPNVDESEISLGVRLSDSLDLSAHISQGAMFERLVYQKGLAGTGQPYVSYPRLDFRQDSFFALGSPIGMFIIVRGIDKVDSNYKLPNCSRFFNIFHPYDPVAYRIEPIIDTYAAQIPPFMMDHHKGRKRFHLELKENLTKMGANFKRNIISSVQSTIHAIQDFARAHTGAQKTDQSNVDVHDQENSMAQQFIDNSLNSVTEIPEQNIEVGQLNAGSRIDFVLQEAPLESLNEYLFALSSHCCYWTSEDTAFFMLQQLYSYSELETSSSSPL